MSMHQIERQFTRIGARANVHPPIVRRWGMTPEVSIDIGNDAEGDVRWRWKLQVANDIAVSSA